MAKINIRQIMEDVVQGASRDKRIEREAKNQALIVMRNEKNNLVEDFDNHPITRELDQYNSNPDLISEFLPRGNLFSFIGFNRGDKPTESARAVLKDQVRLMIFPTKKKKRDGIIFSFVIKEPRLQDIWDVTTYPDNWKSGSWANDIEQNGIDNLAYYMFSKVFETKGKSRSGRGLQLKREVNSGASMDSFPYIRDLLNKFRSNITRHNG